MKAVIFDLFGTLVGIDAPSHPYRKLLANVRDPAARHAVMCQDVSLPYLSRTLGLNVPPAEVLQCEADIDEEVSRIFVYPEVRSALEALREQGVVIIVSSNLAKPYGKAKELLRDLVDYWSLSYETGILKPDPEMVRAPAAAFGFEPSDCLVVGDSWASDGGAAFAAGMRFVHLQRKSAGLNGEARDIHQALNSVLALR